MNSKIIYEKKYQHRFQEIENEANKKTSEGSIPTHHIDANDFLKRTFEKAVFVLIPERVEKSPFLLPWQFKMEKDGWQTPLLLNMKIEFP